MTHDIIKVEIPEEISEDGGASVRLVNKTTVPLDTSIKEALDGMYVIGNQEFIRGQFEGLVKSMAAGVQRDGHSRQLGDYLTLYAQPTGEVDLDKGWDPDVNKMVLKVGQAVHLNGVSLPNDARVEWEVAAAGKSGKVDSAQISGDATRIDLAAEALSELAAEVYNGKTITFKVRGNKANASVKATLKYAAPAQPTITKVYSEGKEDTGKVASTISKLYIKGTGLNAYELNNLSLYGADDPLTIPAGASLTKTDTEIA